MLQQIECLLQAAQQALALDQIDRERLRPGHRLPFLPDHVGVHLQGGFAGGAAPGGEGDERGDVPGQRGADRVGEGGAGKVDPVVAGEHRVRQQLGLDHLRLRDALLHPDRAEVRAVLGGEEGKLGQRERPVGGDGRRTGSSAVERGDARGEDGPLGQGLGAVACAAGQRRAERAGERQLRGFSAHGWLKLAQAPPAMAHGRAARPRAVRRRAANAAEPDRQGRRVDAGRPVWGG